MNIKNILYGLIVIFSSSSVYAVTGLPKPHLYTVDNTKSARVSGDSHGEVISRASGTVEWRHVDFAQTGVGAPLEIARVFKQGRTDWRELANWELDIPKITFTASSEGYLKGQTTLAQWSEAICKDPRPKTDRTNWAGRNHGYNTAKDDWWTGVNFTFQGQSKQLIRINETHPNYPSHTDYLSKDGWIGTCKPSAGSKFILNSPDGSKYFFDKINVAHGDFYDESSSPGLITLLPSKIVDRNGNTTTYTFEKIDTQIYLTQFQDLFIKHKLRFINTSDGRKVEFKYTELNKLNLLYEALVYSTSGKTRVISYNYSKMPVSNEHTAYCQWMDTYKWEDGRMADCKKRIQQYSGINLISVDIKGTLITNDWMYQYHGPTTSRIYDGIALGASLSLPTWIKNPQNVIATYKYKESLSHIYDESRDNFFLTQTVALDSKEYTTGLGHKTKVTYTYTINSADTTQVIVTAKLTGDGPNSILKWYSRRTKDAGFGLLEKYQVVTVKSDGSEQIIYTKDITYKDLFDGNLGHPMPLNPLHKHQNQDLHKYAYKVVSEIKENGKITMKASSFDQYGRVKNKSRPSNVDPELVHPIKDVYISNYIAFNTAYRVLLCSFRSISCDTDHAEIPFFNSLLQTVVEGGIGDFTNTLDNSYDLLGNLTETRGGGVTTKFFRNSDGTLERIETPIDETQTKVISFKNYKLGIAQETYINDILVKTLIVDEWGDVVSQKQPDGRETITKFNTRHEPTSVSYVSQDGVTYSNTVYLYFYDSVTKLFRQTTVEGDLQTTHYYDGSTNYTVAKSLYSSGTGEYITTPYKHDFFGNLVKTGETTTKTVFDSSMPYVKLTTDYDRFGRILFTKQYTKDGEVRGFYTVWDDYAFFKPGQFGYKTSLPDSTLVLQKQDIISSFFDRVSTSKNIIGIKGQGGTLIERKIDDLGRLTSSKKMFTNNTGGILETVEYKVDYDPVFFTKPKNITYPDDMLRTFTYDPVSGTLTKEVLGDVETSYTQDSFGRVETKVEADNTRTFDYYLDDKIKSTITSDGLTKYAYTYFDNGVLRNMDADLYGEKYTYSQTIAPNGTVTSKTYPSGKVVTQGFDLLHNNLEFLSGYIDRIEYYGDAKKKSVEYANYVVKGFKYDEFDLLDQESLMKLSTTLFNFDYDFDNRNRMTSAVDLSGNFTNQGFDYDRDSQLIEYEDNTKDYEYSYDVSGRHKALEIDGAIVNAVLGTDPITMDTLTNGEKVTYNDSGSITDLGSKKFKYVGLRLTEDDIGNTYHYDSNGFIGRKTTSVGFNVYVRTPSGKLITEYQSQYDKTKTFINYEGKAIAVISSSLLDSDKNGIVDYKQAELGPDGDNDGDGLSNYTEWRLGLDMNQRDTDADGIDDGYEVEHGLDPLSEDSFYDMDGDGLANIFEYHAGTDPKNPDTDNDGILDGSDANPLQHLNLIPALGILL